MGSYNYLKLAKKLKKLGFQFHRQGRGSHVIWVNEKVNTIIPVPNHGGKDIRKGTLQEIIKELGLKNIRELDEI